MLLVQTLEHYWQQLYKFILESSLRTNLVIFTDKNVLRNQLDSITSKLYIYIIAQYTISSATYKLQPVL